MKLIDVIRLVRRHIVLLVLIPVLLGALVAFLTRKPDYKFNSETTLYTGLATGMSVEIDKTFNFASVNAAFDNLINIIKSRETQQEVAIRLLSQHLMLEKPDPKFISARHFYELRRITPKYIYGYIAKKEDQGTPEAASRETANSPGSGSSFLFPESIDKEAYEKTVLNLTELMNSSDTNFVYTLLNYTQPNYSFNALSAIKVQRVYSSDLLKIEYQTDDPGICQQTLLILNEVCIRNYKSVKENRSDAVVKYFERQLANASKKLNEAEDKLLQFNMDNNIINYYEQSKAVAGMKEELDAAFNGKKVELAGLEASIARLEEKLGNQQQIQLRSSEIVDLKNMLGALSYKIASAESRGVIADSGIQDLATLKAEYDKLKDDIKTKVNDLYKYGNSAEGLPLKELLAEWLSKVIAAEDARASLRVMAENYKEFLKQYAIYAPAGANLKRIEREISVSENEFLEILHSLNQANLKLQDNEFSSNIKAVDPPYYPLNPVPTKRKILVLAGALIGFLMLITLIFAMEYLDNTLRNPEKASSILKLPFLGVLPKVFLKAGTLNMPFILNRLTETSIQNIELMFKAKDIKNSPRTIAVISTIKLEGKTVFAANIARKLTRQGKKVLYLNYSTESLEQFETEQISNNGNSLPDSVLGNMRQTRQFSFLSSLLGYPDQRISFNSPFLKDPDTYLKKENCLKYKTEESFYETVSYKDILAQNGFDPGFTPDYVIIELPPVLYYPYPAGLISGIDLAVLVCRSNRVWTAADSAALEIISKLTDNKVCYVLNGVELLALESVLGELPKERSALRQMIKKVFSFQFFSKDRI
jgi:polysaccharide biosynthesis transport protein